MLDRRGRTVTAGDTVLVFHGHNDIVPLLVVPGAELHCKAGKFRHDDIIGVTYGSRVKGKNNALRDKVVPSIVILQNSADLWTLAVPHRTQIIYDTDIAVIVMNLRLKPGSVVAEAGTGSGSLTHSLARAVAPHGKVFTFDFHKPRCLEAREEFRLHGIADIVESNWRDICTTGENRDEGETYEERHSWERKEGDATADAAAAAVAVESDVDTARAGYGLPKHSVDAVFLDVPAPWAAIENVVHVLKPGGILCTFSPCIEQTQRTMERLRAEPHDFVDIRTVEALTKYFNPVYKKTKLEDGREIQRTKFCAEATSKGHSAYLSFARRRLPPVPLNNGDDGEQEDSASKEN